MQPTSIKDHEKVCRINSDQTSGYLREAALRVALNAGSTLKVVCTRNAYRNGPAWYGIWTVDVTDSFGRVQRLVTSRGAVREFKTLNGVVSFLVDLGFERVDIPLMV